jgi:ABC-type transporter Mla MlaB component
MFDVRRDGARIEVRGALDAEGGSALLREVVSTDSDVSVDGSRLERIDGAGLTALAVARSECRARGRNFAVTTVAPDALRGLRAGHVLPRLFAAPSSESDEPTEAAEVESPSPDPPARGPGRLRAQLHWHREHGR